MAELIPPYPIYASDKNKNDNNAAVGAFKWFHPT
jgi:hypothetical protein